MRIWPAVLAALWLLLPQGALARELEGRVVSVHPEAGEIVIVTPSSRTARVKLAPEEGPAVHPGDWVRLDLREREGGLFAEELRVLRRGDRTGVRRRLKMRRGFRGKGKR